MTFQETIKHELQEALKSKDELKLSVLRMLSSALHNRGIEKRGKTGEAELTEEEELLVLRSEVKKRKDAIAEFGKGGRQDLVQKESTELKILDKYLPGEPDDEEIESTVREAIKTFGEVTPKDFGRIIGEVMKRLKGQASGERVSTAVKKALGI